MHLVLVLMFGPQAFIGNGPCHNCKGAKGPCGRSDLVTGNLACTGYSFSQGFPSCPPSFYDCNKACPIVKFMGLDSHRSGVCNGLFHRALDQDDPSDPYPVYKGKCKDLGGEAILSFTPRYRTWVISDRVHDMPKWSLMALRSEVHIPSFHAGRYLRSLPPHSCLTHHPQN
jgi:hypothetical protein